ncbi:hypothetical protein VFPPC_16789 [Pochonia chlamydosporia 170]|uniref:Uncharacterized protein n=1 Tax=Pochonia chlamydosporia 170 TaxID=1380566 RepID=A0A179F589_METCM|nr:hypothetical protein VFPPC_16789 [Pochonia chlamydosporia 170]OAQ60279.1 hypothetical protein VFPPC_16789 [Pochonia chlamydosporia 170]
MSAIGFAKSQPCFWLSIAYSLTRLDMMKAKIWRNVWRRPPLACFDGLALCSPKRGCEVAYLRVQIAQPSSHAVPLMQYLGRSKRGLMTGCCSAYAHFTMLHT